MLGENGENGVSTTLVLCMGPYAHVISNHAKKGHLIKNAILPS